MSIEPSATRARLFSSLATAGSRRIPVEVEFDASRPKTGKMTPVTYQGMQADMAVGHSFLNEFEINMLNGATNLLATPIYLRPDADKAVFSYRGDANRSFMLRDVNASRVMSACVQGPLEYQSGYRVYTRRDTMGILETDKVLIPGQTVNVKL